MDCIQEVTTHTLQSVGARRPHVSLMPSMLCKQACATILADSVSSARDITLNSSIASACMESGLHLGRVPAPSMTHPPACRHQAEMPGGAGDDSLILSRPHGQGIGRLLPPDGSADARR
jgi:hypothetical protein